MNKIHHFQIGIVFQDGTVADFRHNEFNPIRGYMSVQERVASILDQNADLRVAESVVVAPLTVHAKSHCVQCYLRGVA